MSEYQVVGKRLPRQITSLDVDITKDLEKEGKKEVDIAAY